VTCSWLPCAGARQLEQTHWRLACGQPALRTRQQVTRLAGKGTVAVACGASYSAAVLHDGSLHTWGGGLGGQLGLGPAVSAAVWPTRVLAGLEGIRCVVACVCVCLVVCLVVCVRALEDPRRCMGVQGSC
jgi:hypothetical protein